MGFSSTAKYDWAPIDSVNKAFDIDCCNVAGKPGTKRTAENAVSTLNTTSIFDPANNGKDCTVSTNATEQLPSAFKLTWLGSIKILEIAFTRDIKTLRFVSCDCMPSYTDEHIASRTEIYELSCGFDNEQSRP
jgi:hypothetical protein